LLVGLYYTQTYKTTNDYMRLFMDLLNNDPKTTAFTLGWIAEKKAFKNIYPVHKHSTNSSGKPTGGKSSGSANADEERLDFDVRYQSYPIDRFGVPIRLDDGHGKVESVEDGFVVRGINDNATLACPPEFLGGRCELRALCQADDSGKYKRINAAQFLYLMLNESSSLPMPSVSRRQRQLNDSAELYHPRLYAYCVNRLGDYRLHACPINKLITNKSVSGDSSSGISVRPFVCSAYDVCSDHLSNTKHKYQINDTQPILNPNEYYICSNGHSQLKRCASNAVFSVSHNACVGDIDCLGAGNKQLPLDKHNYIQCNNDHGEKVHCKLGVSEMYGIYSCFSEHNKCKPEEFVYSDDYVSFLRGRVVCMDSKMLRQNSSRLPLYLRAGISDDKYNDVGGIGEKTDAVSSTTNSTTTRSEAITRQWRQRQQASSRLSTRSSGNSNTNSTENGGGDSGGNKGNDNIDEGESVRIADDDAEEESTKYTELVINCNATDTRRSIRTPYIDTNNNMTSLFKYPLWPREILDPITNECVDVSTMCLPGDDREDLVHHRRSYDNIKLLKHQRDQPKFNMARQTYECADNEVRVDHVRMGLYTGNTNIKYTLSVYNWLDCRRMCHDPQKDILTLSSTEYANCWQKNNSAARFYPQRHQRSPEDKPKFMIAFTDLDKYITQNDFTQQTVEFGFNERPFVGGGLVLLDNNPRNFDLTLFQRSKDPRYANTAWPSLDRKVESDKKLAQDDAIIRVHTVVVTDDQKYYLVTKLSTINTMPHYMVLAPDKSRIIFRDAPMLEYTEEFSNPKNNIPFNVPTLLFDYKEYKSSVP